MERTRPTTVVVDGVAVGQEFSISAPQRYDLTTQLTPGEHTLEIIVDNGESIPAAVRNSSHACTESTQTNWNGIIGDFHILATDPMHLENVKIIPDIDNREFKISGDFTGDKNHGAKVTVKSGNNSASTVIKPNAPQHFEIILPAYDTPLWSEWDPQLCDITISLEDKSGSIRDSPDNQIGTSQIRNRRHQFHHQWRHHLPSRQARRLRMAYDSPRPHGCGFMAELFQNP